MLESAWESHENTGFCESKIIGIWEFDNLGFREFGNFQIWVFVIFQSGYLGKRILET